MRASTERAPSTAAQRSTTSAPPPAAPMSVLLLLPLYGRRLSAVECGDRRRNLVRALIEWQCHVIRNLLLREAAQLEQCVVSSQHAFEVLPQLLGFGRGHVDQEVMDGFRLERLHPPEE